MGVVAVGCGWKGLLCLSLLGAGSVVRHDEKFCVAYQLSPPPATPTPILTAWGSKMFFRCPGLFIHPSTAACATLASAYIPPQTSMRHMFSLSPYV